jgi:hypothetical protein
VNVCSLPQWDLYLDALGLINLPVWKGEQKARLLVVTTEAQYVGIRVGKGQAYAVAEHVLARRIQRYHGNN